jgi:hypothetical protein
VIDLKRAIKHGGGDYILWLSVTCAPIDVLPPISVTMSKGLKIMSLGVISRKLKTPEKFEK